MVVIPKAGQAALGLEGARLPSPHPDPHRRLRLCLWWPLSCGPDRVSACISSLTHERGCPHASPHCALSGFVFAWEGEVREGSGEEDGGEEG